MPIPTTSNLAESLAQLLEKSRATESFRADALAMARGNKGVERIAYNPVSPPVKVVRMVCALLSAHPDFTVTKVSVEGFSGCSDYVGVLDATLASGVRRRFEFAWDCKWKAEQLGWTDDFGLPDQMRAAREFGWDCVKTWREIKA